MFLGANVPDQYGRVGIYVDKIRSILETRWDNKTRPIAKATLKRAMGERSQIRRAGYFN